jgi:uncharacterized protein YcbK (DUF882 family)
MHGATIKISNEEVNLALIAVRIPYHAINAVLSLQCRFSEVSYKNLHCLCTSTDYFLNDVKYKTLEVMGN